MAPSQAALAVLFSLACLASHADAGKTQEPPLAGRPGKTWGVYGLRPERALIGTRFRVAVFPTQPATVKLRLQTRGGGSRFDLGTFPFRSPKELDFTFLYSHVAANPKGRFVLPPTFLPGIEVEVVGSVGETEVVLTRFPLPAK